MEYRFTVADNHNPWVREIVVSADDEDEARQRLWSWMFARRSNIDLVRVGQ